MDDLNKKLLPCPFCGGPARIEGIGQWRDLLCEHEKDCVLDGDTAEMSYLASSAPDVVALMVAKWNRRTPPVPQAAPSGYALVPLHATREQVEAGQKADTYAHHVLDVYDAMLAAAPATPAAQAQQPAGDGWISVDERRPTDHTKRYLVMSNWGIRLGRLHDPRWLEGVFQDAETGNDEGMYESNKAGAFKVSHWRDLPPAPGLMEAE